MSNENKQNVEATESEKQMAERFDALCAHLKLDDRAKNDARKQLVSDYSRLGTTPNQAINTDIKQALKEVLAERTLWEKTKEALFSASIVTAGVVVGVAIGNALSAKTEEIPTADENPFASTEVNRATPRPVKAAL